MANLHQDMVVNIIVKLPVKSILRFRCVSKAWCKLLKDPDFVKKHLNHAIQMNRFSVMMLTFFGPFSYDLDTETYTLAYDPSLSTLSNPVRIDYPSRYRRLGIEFWGTCNGLICGSSGGESENCVFLWNPATKEFMEVPAIPIKSADEFSFCKFAFGYDDETDDFKVVRFVGSEDNETLCEVQVYTLKSHSWRSLENIPSLLCAGELVMAQVSVNGASHWLAFSGSKPDKVIAYFDFKDERLDEMPLPRFCNGYLETNLCSLGGSLCLHGSIGGRIDVWEMEYGVSESWAKLATFNQDTIPQFSRQFFSRLFVPLQIVKNGEVLLGYNTDVGYHLDLYDIKGGTSINLKAHPKRDLYYATTFVYVESLVTFNSGTYVVQPE